MTPEERTHFEKSHEDIMARNQQLEEKNKEILKYNQSLQDRLIQTTEQYEIHAEKWIAEVKESRKLKDIIIELLKEKFSKEGE